MTDSGRDAAYAMLIDSLIALRKDPATTRFDEYLEHAQAAGRIDAATARALRWWQRQSVRGVDEFLQAVLPDLLLRIERADDAARAAVEESDQAWKAAAHGGHPSPTTSEHPVDVEPADPPTQSDRHTVSGRAISDVEPHEAPVSSTTTPLLDSTETGAYDVGDPNHDSDGTDDGAPVRRTLVAGLTFETADPGDD